MQDRTQKKKNLKVSAILDMQARSSHKRTNFISRLVLEVQTWSSAFGDIDIMKLSS